MAFILIHNEKFKKCVSSTKNSKNVLAIYRYPPSIFFINSVAHALATQLAIISKDEITYKSLKSVNKIKCRNFHCPNVCK